MEIAKKRFVTHLLVGVATLGSLIVAFGSSSGDESNMSLSRIEKDLVNIQARSENTDTEKSDISDFSPSDGKEEKKRKGLSLKDLKSSENLDKNSQGSDFLFDLKNIKQENENLSLSKALHNLSNTYRIEGNNNEVGNEFGNQSEDEDFKYGNEEEDTLTESKIMVRFSPFHKDEQKKYKQGRSLLYSNLSSDEFSLQESGQEEESFGEKTNQKTFSSLHVSNQDSVNEKISHSSDSENGSAIAKREDSGTSSDEEEEAVELQMGQHVLSKKIQRQIRKNEKKKRNIKTKTVEW